MKKKTIFFLIKIWKENINKPTKRLGHCGIIVVCTCPKHKKIYNQITIKQKQVSGKRVENKKKKKPRHISIKKEIFQLTKSKLFRFGKFPWKDLKVDSQNAHGSD